MSGIVQLGGQGHYKLVSKPNFNIDFEIGSKLQVVHQVFDESVKDGINKNFYKFDNKSPKEDIMQIKKGVTVQIHGFWA